MQKEIILEEIVKGYRDTIYFRYQYHHIKENYTISDSITKETVDELRSYFLDYMYPEMHKRTQLNKAFESLDHYTKNPKKTSPYSVRHHPTHIYSRTTSS